MGVRNTRRVTLVTTALALVFALPACGPAGAPLDDAGADASANAQRPRAGGALTVTDTTRDAFARPARGLSDREHAQFFVGNSFFNQNWVSAPASAEGRDGLGPTFNATSCSGCHFKDGRGRPPERDDEPFEGLLLRLSVAGATPHGGPAPEPTYGGQLNHRAILGVPAEGTPRVRYEERAERYPDGAPYSLRVPSYWVEAPQFGALAAGAMLSPRVAPAVFGLGLLEAIEASAIEALADPDDRDGDGISGRPNYGYDPRSGRTALGRFGWKASQPSLEAQNAAAFLGDLGITTELFSEENCPSPQTACAAAPHGGSPELDASKLAAVTLYTRALAVPARRSVDDPVVQHGEALFRASGCASCHVETLTTAARFEPFPLVAGQTLHPYTDLLLHDMGAGLADERPDFLATGREWRTPPLWGIGLQRTVNRHTYLLHDGRARSIEEAVLWHDGEAHASRERFRALRADERAALLTFLSSL